VKGWTCFLTSYTIIGCQSFNATYNFFAASHWSFEHFLNSKRFVKGVCLVRMFERYLSLVKSLKFLVLLCFVVRSEGTLRGG
jgi:hypothetical protein